VYRSRAAILLGAMIAVIAAGCGSGPGEEVVATFDDGSTATVANATDHELRTAAIAMETVYTVRGAYDGEAMFDQLDSGDGRLYPEIDLDVVVATGDDYCVEGGAGGYLKHVQRGELTPQDGGC
jgi:hypothetical protein